jgi:CheY-like chemotaxis protein
MGISNVIHARTSAEAVRLIRGQHVNMLITEWDMKGPSGLDLVRFLRRSDESPNRALPIIMLTGRGEIADVQMARDIGITEFVVKPFSAQTLFVRLEQIIDNPRSFVVSKGYVGPERRRKGLPPPGVAERRATRPVAAVPTRDGINRPVEETPVIFSPDFSLRQAIGNKPLASMITPDVLKEAQAAIEAMSEQSMGWVREDLEQMQEAYTKLEQVYSAHAFEAVKASALNIKSRAGTFGYRMASDVARLLYLFLSTNFIPTNPRHLVVIKKHSEVLTVLFAKKIKEREGIGAELYSELDRLIAINK